MVDRSERIGLIAELRDELGELSSTMLSSSWRSDLGFMTTDDCEFVRTRELGRLLRAATDEDLVSLGSPLGERQACPAAGKDAPALIEA